MKSTFLTAAAFGIALGAPAALAQTATTTEGAATTEAPAAEAPEVALDSKLAEINGVPLTLGELIAIRRELPAQYQGLPDEVLFTGLTEQLIDQLLLADAAKSAGLDKKPSVALRILSQDRAILAEAYLRHAIEERVTPEAIKALYDERYVNGEPEIEVHAGHILVDSEEKAAEIKAKIDAGGDFAELAKEHGTDGTASQGGDLGWFVQGDMVPEFGDAVFAMEPGTVSGPVKTAFGWHIIKLDERRPRAAPPLEEVQNELANELAGQAQTAVVDELRAAATIVMPETPLPANSIRADALLDAAE